LTERVTFGLSPADIARELSTVNTALRQFERSMALNVIEQKTTLWDCRNYYEGGDGAVAALAEGQWWDHATYYEGV